MSILSFFNRRKDFFTVEEKQQIVNAVRNAERMTSGEVRVFVESKCSYMDALDRAAELFFHLKMNETKERNAVILYVAMEDKQLAIFADKGIHQKVDADFWNREVKKMISNFDKSDYAKGISEVVTDIGEVLENNFPFDRAKDKNELPDEMIFGK